MGRRIPYDTARRLAGADEQNTSIFCPSNRYGYRININHPQIRPLYEAYKRRIGEMILSDAQRFAFEEEIFRMLQQK